MKRVMTASVMLGMALSIAWTAHGGEAKDKVHTVGKDGLTAEVKLGDDAKSVEFKFSVGGMEIARSMKAKLYTVKMQANKKYTMTLDKTDGDVDTFLIVQDAGGKILVFNDDSNGTLNSALAFNPSKAGAYKVYAAALTGTGTAALKIVESESNLIDAKKVYAAGKKELILDGVLTPDQRKIDVQVKLKAGKSYRIDLKSRSFDAFLTLSDGGGMQLAQDDDGGDGLNSRITHRAGADGTYRITATSLGMRGAGAFTLEIREEE